MKRTETRAVFPMHFWGNYGIFDRLALEKNAGEYADKIHRIEKEGQVVLNWKKAGRSSKGSVRNSMPAGETFERKADQKNRLKYGVIGNYAG